MNAPLVRLARAREAREARATAQARPTRGTSPTLPPLDALDRTHRQMLATLAELDNLLNRLADQGGVDALSRQLARQVCDFFAGHARQHHADEEAHVFPPLITAGDPVLVRQVMRLQQDHGWLEEDWLALEPQLEAVAGGYSWYEPELLAEGVAVFSALYREHIALEESMVYPAARQKIAADAEALRHRLLAD